MLDSNDPQQAVKGVNCFPFYTSIQDTHGPAKNLNLSGLVQMIENPRIGSKETAPAITPYQAAGKKKEHALESLYYAVVVDHDHDDKTAEGIQNIYDPYGMAYIAFTTSSHQLPGKGNRWKIIIPLARPSDHGRWLEIAIGATLKTSADAAQARTCQVFYAPNILYENAVYEFIDKTDRPFVDLSDTHHNFVADCFNAYTQNEAAKDHRAVSATPKPRVDGANIHGTIIEQVNQTFSLSEVLTGHGYQQKGKKYLYPDSETGMPGVVILEGNRCYSHHGAGDPLSNLNNGGHSLDCFGVICLLAHSGDVSSAIKRLAPMVDPDGQKKRQREYMKGKGQDKNPVINPAGRDMVLERAKEILDSQRPCGSFDIKNLPGNLSRYISALCDETAAEPILLLQSALCSISAIMRKNYCIPDGEYFQRLYAVIWMVSITESGGFKTTSLNKGAAACFQIRKEFQKQIQVIQGNGGTPNDEDLKRMIEIERQIPILPSRVTAEGLLELLAQGCGGQILCSEFGEWLENISKSFAGALKATLTDFYDVPQNYDYKTRTQGHIKVEEPFITINAVSTQDWVIRNLQPDDVTSGFFARFLLFNPPAKNIIPSALPAVRHKAPAITEFVDTLKGMAAIFADYKQPVEYTLPGETRQLFEAYHRGLYDALYAESDRAKQILGPYVKRWSPYLLKIAMVLQCVDDPDSTLLKPQMLEYSKGIVDYAVKSTTHLFKNELGETEHQRKCRKILEYIARHGGKRTWGQLLQSHVLDGGANDYGYPCQTLEESNQIIFDRPAGQKGKHILILNTELEKLEKT